MADELTPESIAEAATAPASASKDGQSATAVPIDQQIKAAEYKAAADAASEPNEQGGQKSGWRGLRPARPIFPGHTN